MSLYNQHRPKNHQKSSFTTKKKSNWVDVNDSDNSPKKRPYMNYGNAIQPMKKKQRLSNEVSRTRPNGIVNGYRPLQMNGAGTSQASSLQEQRANLPIAQGKEALLDEIRKNDVTVLLGETGSGKTTQVPQYLLESGLAGTGMIAVTQPRKVAATSLAARVAAEQGGRVGNLVGYSVRFDESSSSETRIKYMTDGMIVRELLSDPTLSKYSVVIVDEAHERTLRTDLLMANLKAIQRARNTSPVLNGKGKGKADATNPLKIIIMSATLDAEKFSAFFSNAKIIYVKGRQHPVTIYHSAEGQTDYVESAMRVFFQIHVDQPPGDVLIFLPGQEDIESLEKSIQLFAARLPAERPNVLTCPMFASQEARLTAKVFLPAPQNTRKCILATNVAETSITIPGVKYVIDSGKAKENRYFALGGGGIDSLVTVDINKSSAMQRAGRAGREGVGFCYRLYTEAAFKALPASSEPEILRVPLTSSVLQLRCLGQKLEELDLMDKPESDAILSALKALYFLGALDQESSLTTIGRDMAAFPLEPHYARALLASKELGCTREVLEIISVLSASSKVFFDVSDKRDALADARKKFQHHTGDHLTILNVARAYEDVCLSENNENRREWCAKHFVNLRTLKEARKIKEQLQQTCARVGLDPKVSCKDEDESIRKSFGHGLVANAALLQPDGSYKQIMSARVVKIHPSSTLVDKKVPAIIYDSIIFTNQVYVRGVSAIPKEFLVTLPIFAIRTA